MTSSPMISKQLTVILCTMDELLIILYPPLAVRSPKSGGIGRADSPLKNGLNSSLQKLKYSRYVHMNTEITDKCTFVDTFVITKIRILTKIRCLRYPFFVTKMFFDREPRAVLVITFRHVLPFLNLQFEIGFPISNWSSNINLHFQF